MKLQRGEMEKKSICAISVDLKMKLDSWIFANPLLVKICNKL